MFGQCLDPHLRKSLSRAAEALDQSDALLITAGAGMGVDSGLPDFRGREGFWQAYPAYQHLGLTFEELANPSWFRTDPQLAWGFYGHRLNLYRHTVPHPGFSRLLEHAKTLEHGFFVFTSNVDGQFQKAGFPEGSVYECHGSIHELQCTRPCGGQSWSAEHEHVTVDTSSFRAGAPLPQCPLCGAIARPNVLMFGDWQWCESRSAAQRAALDTWLGSVGQAGAKLAVIELGAGTSIPTVRRASEAVCSRFGGTLVRVNLREAHVPPGHISVEMRAAEAISTLFPADLASG